MGKSEIDSLTAVRGLAAWWVVFFHFKTFLPASIAPVLSLIIGRGYLAVDLFFILSGFVIFWNYFNLSLVDKNELGAFALKRFARIYPLHLVIIALYLVLLALILAFHHGIPVNRFSGTSLIANLFLLQDWSPSTALTWNDPSWSISAEAAAYAVFPLLAPLISRLNGRAVLAVSFVAVYGILNSVFAFHGFDLGSDIGSVGIVRCITEFALGCIVARMLQMTRHVPMSVAFLLTSFATFAVLGSAKMGTSLTFPIAWSLLIFVLAIYGRSKSPLIGPFTFLGKISYATYMCHYLIYDVFKLVAVHPDAKPSLFLVALAFAAIFLSSVVLHYMVEQRCYRFLIRMGKMAIEADKLKHA